MVEVICIGMATADILAKGVGEVRFGGHTEFVESVSMAVGGDALNQSVVLSRLGHKTSLLTMVGNDAQGRYVVEECGACGVDTSGILRSEQYPTSTSMVLITKDGERSFISQKGGTVDEFCLADADIARIRPGVKVVSIGSLFCSPRLDAQIAAVLKAAKEAGAVTIADMVPNMAGTPLAGICDALPLLDYVVPSKEEALLYTGKKTVPEAARAFLEYGAGTVIVKQGGEGAYVLTAEGDFTVPVCPATVVDTTGAGDNFVSGLICGLLRDFPLTDCLYLASATASISIGAVGATTGVQSFEQVQRVLQKENIEGALL